MKDGIPLSQSTNITTINHTLTSAVFSTTYTISNCDIGDNGTYTCTVSNPIGNHSKSITVIIGKELI